MVALVGESGCGKTTTAQTVMRMVEADRGRDPVPRPGHRASCRARQLRPMRREMQIIFQDPYESLDPRFRVRDTVAEPLLIHGIGDNGKERDERVLEALERAGLTPPDLFARPLPARALGRPAPARRDRRGAGARAEAADRRRAGVDARRLGARRHPVAARRAAPRAAWAILMITHDLSTAAHFADRIAVMYLGRIVEEGPAKEVVRNPRHPYTKALISVVPKRDPRDCDRAADPDRRDAEPGARPARLPLPPALPDRAGELPQRPTRSCAGRRRPTTASPASWRDAPRRGPHPRREPALARHRRAGGPLPDRRPQRDHRRCRACASATPRRRAARRPA